MKLNWVKFNGEEEMPGEADLILCDLLEKLGCDDVVAAYNKIGKWYA
ncbi:MAG: hypothetical protein GY700_06555 [Propionibacteriaceae bacterium]|nr:hypothetical protein [Propionibacteriaceae bacterium]